MSLAITQQPSDNRLCITAIQLDSFTLSSLSGIRPDCKSTIPVQSGLFVFPGQIIRSSNMSTGGCSPAVTADFPFFCRSAKFPDWVIVLMGTRNAKTKSPINKPQPHTASHKIRRARHAMRAAPSCTAGSQAADADSSANISHQFVMSPSVLARGHKIDLAFRPLNLKSDLYVMQVLMDILKTLYLSLKHRMR